MTLHGNDTFYAVRCTERPSCWTTQTKLSVHSHSRRCPHRGPNEQAHRRKAETDRRRTNGLNPTSDVGRLYRFVSQRNRPVVRSAAAERREIRRCRQRRSIGRGPGSSVCGRRTRRRDVQKLPAILTSAPASRFIHSPRVCLTMIYTYIIYMYIYIYTYTPWTSADSALFHVGIHCHQRLVNQQCRHTIAYTMLELWGFRSQGIYIGPLA